MNVAGFLPRASCRASRAASRRLCAAAAAGAAWLLVACAAPAPRDAQTLSQTRPLLLWGEVHDNAAQHTLRRDALARLVASGARPVLVMEHFDRDRQPTIDRLLAAEPPPTAQALVSAAGGTGWPWPLITPLLELALQHRLPIVAANVSREDARRVMRDGLSALGFDADVPPALLAAQAALIEASHCGLLPAGLAPRMALAQVARDQFMARALQQALQRPAAGAAPPQALLLAGNGHVRSDIGVPRWLDPTSRAQALSVGLLEDGSASSLRFDHTVVTAAQPRPDPCAAMKSPTAPSAPSAPSAPASQP